MRRWLAIILALALLLTTGCSGKNKGSDETIAETSADENSQQEIVATIIPETTPHQIDGTTPAEGGEEAEDVTPQLTYDSGALYEPFGIPNTFSLATDQGTVTFTLNIPEFDSKPYEYNNALHMRTDDTGDSIIISWLNASGTELEDCLPAIEGAVKEEVLRYAPCEIVIELEESSIVENGNGIALMKAIYSAQYHYSSDSVVQHHIFVYATKLDNGVYLYWAQWCGSRYMDQRRLAENMAYTFTIEE